MIPSPPIRWASLAIAIAAVGKTWLTVPDPWLVVAGLAYALTLWPLTDAHIGQSSWRWTWLVGSTLALMAVIVTSRNEALLAYTPLVLVAAMAVGLRPAAFLTGGVVLWATAVAILWQDPWVAVVQIFVTMAASGAFLVAFSRLVLQTRLDAVRIVAQSEKLAELSALVERRRVAQEVHDGVGHYLSAAIVHLEAARVNREVAPAEADVSVLKARELVSGAMREIRRAVVALQGRSPSLTRAIDELVATSNDVGITTQFECHGEPRRLSTAVEWALFSTAQECLTNVRRHATARSAQLHLRYGAETVELTVRDDGSGAETLLEGTGLTAIRERAELLGGSCHWGSIQPRGFEVYFQVTR